MKTNLFAPTHVLMRELSRNFDRSLKENTPSIPINVDLAQQQHHHYVQLLQSLIPNHHLIKAEHQYPDCCFIEDTAIVIGSTALVSHLGAPERRGEEVEVKKVLKDLVLNHNTIKNVHELEAPGLLDGGDVLFTGEDILIGLSKRTNLAAIDQMRKIFKKELKEDGNIYCIPVTQGLHLKSAISAVGERMLVVSKELAGKSIQRAIEAIPQLEKKYTFIHVPESVAANVLRIGSTLIIQDGFPMSEIILTEFAWKQGLSLKKLKMSEFIKADGCLTCCSILFGHA